MAFQRNKKRTGKLEVIAFARALVSYEGADRVLSMKEGDILQILSNTENLAKIAGSSVEGYFIPSLVQIVDTPDINPSGTFWFFYAPKQSAWHNCFEASEEIETAYLRYCEKGEPQVIELKTSEKKVQVDFSRMKVKVIENEIDEIHQLRRGESPLSFTFTDLQIAAKNLVSFLEKVEEDSTIGKNERTWGAQVERVSSARRMLVEKVREFEENGKKMVQTSENESENVSRSIVPKSISTSGVVGLGAPPPPSQANKLFFLREFLTVLKQLRPASFNFERWICSLIEEGVLQKIYLGFQTENLTEMKLLSTWINLSQFFDTLPSIPLSSNSNPQQITDLSQLVKKRPNLRHVETVARNGIVHDDSYAVKFKEIENEPIDISKLQPAPPPPSFTPNATINTLKANREKIELERMIESRVGQKGSGEWKGRLEKLVERAKEMKKKELEKKNAIKRITDKKLNLKIPIIFKVSREINSLIKSLPYFSFLFSFCIQLFLYLKLSTLQAWLTR